MTALTVIHLNGPINSGKTTIGLALARVLPDACFIDGDDHDAPPDDAPLDVQWALALERLVAQIAAARERHLVIAYPIGEAEHARLRAACDARDARLFVVTLAPPEAIAASKYERPACRACCHCRGGSERGELRHLNFVLPSPNAIRDGSPRSTTWRASERRQSLWFQCRDVAKPLPGFEGLTWPF
ncbi:hypothetical protein [Burkholderia seminalis]|uniref:hypothetical protein n=1 Tax=Burkholderia seminalis TaxID=488731 RepID=UPI000ACAB356|nr:hypothetical protein [Burkholderia seminalis]MCA8039841.1 hypothetical protein [Burkholderia seminalis]